MAVRIGVPEDVGSLQLPGGRATYTRSFNRPTGLDEDSKVAIRISDWEGDLESVALNGNKFQIGPAPTEIDVTVALEDRNELVVQLVSADEKPCRFSGEVNLLIT